MWVPQATLAAGLFPVVGQLCTLACLQQTGNEISMSPARHNKHTAVSMAAPCLCLEFMGEEAAGGLKEPVAPNSGRDSRRLTKCVQWASAQKGAQRKFGGTTPHKLRPNFPRTVLSNPRWSSVGSPSILYSSELNCTDREEINSPFYIRERRVFEESFFLKQNNCQQHNHESESNYTEYRYNTSFEYTSSIYNQHTSYPYTSPYTQHTFNKSLQNTVQTRAHARPAPLGKSRGSADQFFPSWQSLGGGFS